MNERLFVNNKIEKENISIVHMAKNKKDKTTKTSKSESKISRWKRRRLHRNQMQNSKNHSEINNKSDSAKSVNTKPNIPSRQVKKSVTNDQCNSNILSDKRKDSDGESLAKCEKQNSSEKHQEDKKNGKHSRKKKKNDKNKLKKDIFENVSSNWMNFQQLLLKNKEENVTRKRKLSSEDAKDGGHKKKKYFVNKRGKFASENIKTSKIESTEQKQKPDIWFDDVDEILVEGLQEKKPSEEKGNPLVKLGTFSGLTKAVAMDCEMVGVGEEGRESILARVSIVNQYGNCVYDKYVKPQEDVVDYRTFVSGVTPEHLVNAEDFSVVQKDVCNIMKGRMLVGHALSNDLKVLFLDHPRKMIRDTSTYKPFRQLFGGKTPSLKKLTQKLLGVSVQAGEHDSVQDSQAAMKLYAMYRKKWEKDIKFGLIKIRKEKKRNTHR